MWHLRGSELEARDQGDQALRLIRHVLGGGGALFDQRGILLGRGIHLGDGLIDLLDAGQLFAAGYGDV